MHLSRSALAELLLIGVAAAAATISPAPLLVEDWFATGVYPGIQRALTPLSNALPFAVLDLLLASALAATGVALAVAIRTARRTRTGWPILRLAGHVAGGAAAAYLVFLLLWGFNYRRVPLQDRLVLEPGGPSSGAVVRLGLEAASELNSLHAEAHRIGWPDGPWEETDLRRAFVEVQTALSDGVPARPGRLKKTVLGPYFRWTSVDGMLNPFGLEVLVNPDLLPFERPFVAAHEWAHLAGYADEAEASFVGWLTCLAAGAPSRYSGWLALYWQVRAELNETERLQIGEALAAGPRADLDAIEARIRRGEWPWLRDAGWRAYDTYLKANRVEQGVRSYGAVVTLILRARFDPGWRPVRRTDNR